ncbi:hypothetical protein [Parabacteroides johnsonii]|jgi:hypothetical protein|uniref:hypothetical protein n=1 Tax=Parabacteroides johnsonii TaxID=387661 RepID=UPI00204EA361|nr:hypothetical protein [Parabacteroides johnsonii]DAI59556.1 MAG TPA: hypothetical protein [Caudoviricetes sp.]
MELAISIIGAIVAISVSVIGAYLANKNSIILQTRKLKESHYIRFVSSLHNLCAYNSDITMKARYTEARDIVFLVASTDVITNIIEYERQLENGISQDVHDKLLTNIIKAIRKDLKLKNKSLPTLYFKKT